MATESSSPFETLETAFHLLAAGPDPLGVDGREIGGRLPARHLDVTELRNRLLHPSCDYATRDRAIRLLAERAQQRGSAWVVALAGTLLPGLRRRLAPWVGACPSLAADVEAEALAGLLEAIFDTRLDREKLASCLIWTAVGRGKRLLHNELALQARHLPASCSAEPPRPWGHPDFVLAKAVQAGVINADDAELIGETRLNRISVRTYADTHDLPFDATRQRRLRAERRLVAWLS